MATVNDYGTDETLFSTPFGGPNGWAAAVAAALAVTAGTLTPAAGWADLGGEYAGLVSHQQGKRVTLSAALKPTASATLTVGTGITVATLPVLPARRTIAAAAYGLGSGAQLLGRLDLVASSGAVIFYPAAAGTMTTAGFLSLSCTYLAA